MRTNKKTTKARTREMGLNLKRQ